MDAHARSSSTNAEITRTVHLRAIEWGGWPAFVAQPLLPLAYLRYGVVPSIVFVLLSCLVWKVVNALWVSFSLATAAAFFVRLKWITIPVVFVLFIVRHQWASGAATLTIPLYVALLNPWVARIGRIEARMMADCMTPRHSDARGGE